MWIISEHILRFDTFSFSLITEISYIKNWEGVCLSCSDPNMQQGLFRYNWLQHGVSATPKIFQRTLEGLFQIIDKCVVYIDDNATLLITGATDKEHLKSWTLSLKSLVVYKMFDCDYQRINVYSWSLRCHTWDKNRFIWMSPSTRCSQ